MKQIIQIVIYVHVFSSTLALADEKTEGKVGDNFRVALGGYFITAYEPSL